MASKPSREQQGLLENQEQYYSYKQAFSVFINVMMGIGPIIIPAVFREAGVILASSFTILISFISFLTCEFIVEAMSISNAIAQQSRNNMQVDDQNPNIQNYNENNDDNNNKQQQYYIDEDEEDEIEKQNSNNNNNEENNQQQQEEKSNHFNSGQLQIPAQKLEITSDQQTQINTFLIQQKFEYGQMGSFILGQHGNALITFVVAIYLIGVLIAKCISTGKIMAETFQNVPILQLYEFWLSLFFLISAVFSFKNVQSTKMLQNVIIIVRFTTIGMMVIGCFYKIGVDGFQLISTEKYPLVNISGFESFFSNTVLAFALHHSLPSMLTPVKPEKDIKKVTKYGFITACGVYLALPFLAVVSFGEDLVSEFGLKFFNDDFKEVLPLVFYISSFYMFLNITAFPVLTITTRNNMMKLLSPNKMPAQSWKITKYTLIYTMLIIVPIFTISISTQKIQVVLDIVGGLFGVTLMMILPSLLVIKGRKILKEMKLENSLNIHRTYFPQEWLPKCILVLSIFFLMMDIYIISNKVLFSSGEE